MADEAHVRAAGLGEHVVSDDPADELVAYGLGSCVGLVLWGPGRRRRVMALAHVVMPDSRGRAGSGPARFADSAVPYLVALLTQAGCLAGSLQAVMAGGAAMFAASGGALGDIGASNVARLRDELRRAGIPLRAESVGGRVGRTLRAWVACGRVCVNQLGVGEIDLWPGQAEAGGAAAAGGVQG
jgi:chemotaxis protein CheD